MVDRPSPFLCMIISDNARHCWCLRDLQSFKNWPPVIFIKLNPFCSLKTLKIYVWVSEVKVAQSCPTLCDPMDYTVHGILQARILEWVAFPFSRWSFQPRDGTQVSRIAGRFFTRRNTKEAHSLHDDFHILEASCHIPSHCFYFSSSWILYIIQLFLV